MQTAMERVMQALWIDDPPHGRGGRQCPGAAALLASQSGTDQELAVLGLQFLRGNKTANRITRPE
jgi:hypothetical protein